MLTIPNILLTCIEDMSMVFIFTLENFFLLGCKWTKNTSIVDKDEDYVYQKQTYVTLKRQKHDHLK